MEFKLILILTYSQYIVYAEESGFRTTLRATFPLCGCLTGLASKQRTSSKLTKKTTNLHEQTTTWLYLQMLGTNNSGYFYSCIRFGAENVVLNAHTLNLIMNVHTSHDTLHISSHSLSPMTCMLQQVVSNSCPQHSRERQSWVWLK